MRRPTCDPDSCGTLVELLRARAVALSVGTGQVSSEKKIIER